MSPQSLDKFLIESCDKYPAKTAVISSNQSLSYQELLEKGQALGRMIRDLGVEPGSCVGYILPKDHELLIGIYGIIFSGCIFFPIDPYQPTARLEQVLEQTRPQALICPPESFESLRKLKYCPSHQRIILTRKISGSPQPAMQDISCYLSSKASLPQLSAEDPVYLNFTSGTTGMPKGAVTTHANIFYNTISSIQALSLQSDDIHMCMFPPYVHPHDIFARPIYLGGSMVLVDSVQPKTIASAIANNRVTAFMAVGSIYETLVRLRDLQSRDLGSLKLAESGGMYVSSTLNQAFKDKAGVGITPVWGSTETTGIALANPVGEDFPLKSMGRPCPSYEVQILDQDGHEVEPYQTGEMVVSGPGVCAGYLHLTQETAKYYRQGVFYTQDLAYKDEQGYFYFRSRKTGMLKVGGMRVYPAEVEEVLRSFPHIDEVVVTREEEELHGEVPKALIVSKNGHNISKNELRKYCSRFLHPCKIPRIYEFRSELPRTRGGKIDMSAI